MNAHHHDTSVYRRFTELLHRNIGLDAASLGHGAIERAIDLRAAAWIADGHAGAALADYWNAAHDSPAMLQALIETVIVPETWFYRDADAFNALVRLARDCLHERGAEHSGLGATLPVRILSLPCSTGEEPYTIAMALFDAGLDAAQFRIDAMDISERALALARRARYGRNSFRGNAFAFRDAHFTRVEDGWQLAPRIVDAVRFSRANLMQLDASVLGVYDFVFCRNVLIYFDRDTQQVALQALDSLLAEGGTLFVGPSETGLLMRHGMQSAKIPLAFAFHRSVPDATRRDTRPDTRHAAPIATAAALAMTPSGAPSWASASPSASASAPASAPVFAAQPFASSASVAPIARESGDAGDGSLPASVEITKPPAKPATLSVVPNANTPSAAAAPATTARDALQAARALADVGRLADAAAALQRYLAQHAPHADAFYLLGVLADANGASADARGYYRKALYLDPQHAEALTHLAASLELAGDRDAARLLMQRAARAQGAQRG